MRTVAYTSLPPRIPSLVLLWVFEARQYEIVILQVLGRTWTIQPPPAE